MAEDLGETSLFTFGAFEDSPPSMHSPNRFVEALFDHSGAAISVLYGSRQCLVGVFGPSIALRLRTRIPDYSSLIEILDSMAPGESRSA
jgi:hypothetical protein